MQDILPALGFAAVAAVLLYFQFNKVGAIVAMIALLGLVLGIGNMLGYRI